MHPLLVVLITSSPLIAAFIGLGCSKWRQREEARADEIAKYKNTIAKLRDECALWKAKVDVLTAQLDREKANYTQLDARYRNSLSRENLLATQLSESARLRNAVTAQRDALLQERGPQRTVVLDSLQGLNSTAPKPSPGYWDHLSADD